MLYIADKSVEMDGVPLKISSYLVNKQYENDEQDEEESNSETLEKYMHETYEFAPNQSNDYSIFNLFGDPMSVMFDKKPGFPYPDKPLYGPALLAIKYLDDYCLNHKCLVEDNIADQAEL
jgi:hypothetical protein